MTPIGFVCIERAILIRTDLTDKAKVLLGLVSSMNSQGLIVGNGELAKILCIHENSVSRLLADLQRKDLVRIENPKSRFRRVYSNTSVRVDDDSTQTPALATQTLAQVYSNTGAGHNIRKGQRERTPDKHTHGDFVKLTADEYGKLVERFGEQGTADRIANLDERIGAKGYRYKSHYHTILSWERNRRQHDEHKGNGASTPYESYVPTQAELEKIIQGGRRSHG